MTLKTILLATIAATLPLAASTINMTSGGTNVNGGDYGNVRTFTSGTTTVTVTAYGITGGAGANANTLFQTAQSGQYSNLGLGICSQAEGKGCSDPSHQVDNSGPLEFFLFQFSAPVNLTSVFINPYCGSGCPNAGWDRDVTYYTAANLASNLNLTGLGLATLPAGFNAGTTVNNTPGSGLSISLTGTGINSLLLGTAGPNPDYLVDRFKLKSISFDTSTVVPEPATLGTLGAALVALGMWRRRRKA